jgi:hypothetical protein
MQPMKRVGLISVALLTVAMLSAALSVSVSVAGTKVEVNTALAFVEPPGEGASTGSPAAGADPLNDNNKFVCVIVPVLNSQGKGRCPTGQYEVANDQNGGAIIVYLKLFLQLFSFLIGAIILLVLIIAGIQYITSVGDASRVKAAKGRIVNAITALVLYLMMFAILNFLLPGGILT